MVNKLIQGMIGVVIGLALFPVVNGFVDTLIGTAEAPGDFYDTTVGSLIELLPFLYIIIVIVGLIVYVRRV